MKKNIPKYSIPLHKYWVGRSCNKWSGGTIILFVFFFFAISFKLDNDGSQEYKLKAVFIYNFTQFIEWDPSVKSDDFTIGIMGSSPIEEHLEEIARTKTCNGKKIAIIHFNKPEEISFCHILFIPQSTSASQLTNILSKVPKGTLTVSEKDGYGARGTAINFVIVDNKLKFESNLKAINSAGIKVSSQLLKLAIIVE